MLFEKTASFAGAERLREPFEFSRGETPRKAGELDGIVRLIACGSVDDGKSTLIGRLLWDASPLYDDQREALIGETRNPHNARQPDFSRLVDGLIAEQEQGITIDIAWRFFDTASRRFIIIDAPGHEQYTRNMATGASHADAAVLLVDAQNGIKLQTRRHLAILDLVGVRHVILAVNKMDRVDWSEARYRAIAAEFDAIAENFPGLCRTAIPVSALHGDNVANPSSHMGWYDGPTLLERLESLSLADEREDLHPARFRMPVQLVLRDGERSRGLAGTITAGSIATGDEVIEVRGAIRSRVRRIWTMDGDLAKARMGQSVAIELENEVDVGRGAVLAAPENPAFASRHLAARLVWLGNAAKSSSYVLRTGTDSAPVVHLNIEEQLDLDTLAHKRSSTCEANSIASVRIELLRPIAIDLFAGYRRTGSFMLVDALTGAAVAGGVVTGAEPDKPVSGRAAFVLTRDLLRRGLCADLAMTGEDEAEFFRRTNEVAILMRAAGLAVEISE